MAVIEVCVKRHLALPEDGIDPGMLRMVELSPQQKLVRELMERLPHVVVYLYDQVLGVELLLKDVSCDFGQSPTVWSFNKPDIWIYVTDNDDPELSNAKDQLSAQLKRLITDIIDDWAEEQRPDTYLAEFGLLKGASKVADEDGNTIEEYSSED